ncbi:MAG: ABC transporter ATP-binding protein [Candidatus Thermoplasmatota archaeon]|jgi:putative ABC transport system ATP-binding protein|nr:ABC transporter ATP-binding protein [Candidatus Thermoplasmatota archaeon]MDP7263931.1 ABC transporter ATP-binding protein [Candidatus Thermoplasmatota archaeon]
MISKNIIETENLSKTYKIGPNPVHAIRDLSLSIPRGAFWAIEGSSGSGKSTLLNMLGCIDRPSSGKVIFDGEDVSKKSDSMLTRLRLMNIGFVFQQFYLIPTLKAIENITLPMKEAGIGRSKRRDRALELLEMMGLRKRANHHPNQLSGGEQQRVAIARALANNPKVILADEPTGELDSGTGGKIAELLAMLNKEKGITVVVVTHDRAMASRASRRISLTDGRLDA